MNRQTSLLDPTSTVPFVPSALRAIDTSKIDDPKAKGEAEEENVRRASKRVTFRFGLWGSRAYAAIRDATFDADGVLRNGTAARLKIKYSLRGWEAPEGTPVFKSEERGGKPIGDASDESMDLIPLEWWNEMVEFTNEVNGFGKVEAGK